MLLGRRYRALRRAEISSRISMLASFCSASCSRLSAMLSSVNLMASDACSMPFLAVDNCRPSQIRATSIVTMTPTRIANSGRSMFLPSPFPVRLVGHTHASAVAPNTRPTGHTPLANPAATAGVVPSVMCGRQKLYPRHEQGKHQRVILPLLAECIRQSRETSIVHPHGQIGALDMARANLTRVPALFRLRRGAVPLYQHPMIDGSGDRLFQCHCGRQRSRSSLARPSRSPAELRWQSLTILYIAKRRRRHFGLCIALLHLEPSLDSLSRASHSKMDMDLPVHFCVLLHSLYGIR